jgi:hypothetical protein
MACPAGAAAPPVCLCPSGETATATAKAFLLRKKTTSAHAGDEDNDCAPPGWLHPADRSAVASDKRPAARSQNDGRSGLRFGFDSSNPSNPGGPVPPPAACLFQSIDDIKLRYEPGVVIEDVLTVPGEKDIHQEASRISGNDCFPPRDGSRGQAHPVNRAGGGYVLNI